MTFIKKDFTSFVMYIYYVQVYQPLIIYHYLYAINLQL